MEKINMAELKVGDRVRVKNRADWPLPPGYRLANSEGVVCKIWEEAGPEGYRQYVAVKFDRTRKDVDISRPYNFRRESLEKF
jgi:hypothetical protein